MADSAMVAAAAISVRAMIAPLLIGVAVDGQLRPGTQTSALPTVAPVPLPFRSGAPAAKSISVRAHVDVEAVARVEPAPEVGVVADPHPLASGANNSNATSEAKRSTRRRRPREANTSLLVASACREKYARGASAVVRV